MLKKLFGFFLAAAILAGCESDGSEGMVGEVFKEEVFTLHRHFFEVPASGGTFSVEVASNIEYAVTIPEAFRPWIAALPKSRAVTSAGYRFSVAENADLETREGYVVFAGQSLADTVYVWQAAGEEEEKNFIETIDGLSFEMVYVKGGTFMMGATEEQGDDAEDVEKPVHQVTLSDYYIGKFEVTQELWAKLMDKTLEELRDESGYEEGFYGEGPDYPMYYLDWEDASEFCERLSRATGRNYALPTEAQWEYAARGGEKSNNYKHSGSNTLDDVAWYYDNSGYVLHPVGTKQPNELGIYDMNGNVFELCRDSHGSYSGDSQIDPVGPDSGSSRVLRGGCFRNSVKECRVSARWSINQDNSYASHGFRIVLLP